MILTHLKTSPHTEGEHVDGHVDNLEHDHNFIIETTVESDVRPKKKKNLPGVGMVAASRDRKRGSRTILIENCLVTNQVRVRRFRLKVGFSRLPADACFPTRYLHNNIRGNCCKDAVECPDLVERNSTIEIPSEK